MRELILIKIGGSLITDKNKAFVSKDEVIKKIVLDLKKATKNQNISFLIGNGAGSFGHYPAKKYLGKNDDIIGFAKVKEGVVSLNKKITDALIEQKLPAVSFHPSTFLTASNGEKKELFTESLILSLKNGLIPVIYGDIVNDDKKSYHIFSTEELFSLLLPELSEHYQVKKIIYLTDVKGVLDENGQTIPFVNKGNFKEVKKHIYKLKGYDVTGGMLHKIEKALEMKVRTFITDGREDSVSTIISRNKTSGTIIN